MRAVLRRGGAALVSSTACLFLFLPAGVAQVVAAGQNLTVTTANLKATFQGPDLVGLDNILTGESYLKSAPSASLMNLEIQGAPSQNLEASPWTTSLQAGVTVASLTMQDSVRSVTITAAVDASSQEIVVKLSGQATETGVSAAYWGIAGLDLSAGHLVVPASSGIVIDRQHEQLGSRLQYPYDWQAQMAVYETSASSVVLYSTDSQYLFKQLRIASRVSSTIDLSVATEANGPWSSDTSVPMVEWRLKAFAGDWRTAAAVYRDWLAANRPPVSHANHAWVSDIRTVVQLGTRDSSVLNTLAAELTPSKTLLYIPDWRQSAYDVNYPDYTPASDVASFVAKAHTLGFKVMLHTDLIGVTPSNPDFASVQQWQAKDPGNLQPIGWLWDKPVTTPNRFAWIDPASSAYRSLFIARVSAAVAAVQPDALHLDVSGVMFNDGNGPIDGMTYPQGSVQLHKDLIAAFPNLALGGEGTNDLLYAFDSFAQNWWSGDNTTLLGHPIANFLWNSQASGQTQVLYYGHLGQPTAEDPAFINSLVPIEREGILPALAVNSSTDLDLTDADVARFMHWLQSWQINGFHPDWAGAWNSQVPYVGSSGSNATAALSDSGTVIRLDSGGSPIYQRIHDTNQVVSPNTIPSWPAFDSTTLYGLDPTKQYWVDAAARPSTTHVSGLASGVELGPDTAVPPSFALIQLAATPPYDFVGNLWAATIGTTFNGTDGPLAYGATAEPLSITAGGVTKTGIFMQPPYLQGKAGGEAFVEWAVPVPPDAQFSFSVGVGDNAGTCTDGVTFRVAVNGVESWRQNVLHQGWVDGSVSLASYSGTTTRLRIVTNPGPANNPNCDWAGFSDLALNQFGATTTSVPMALAPGAVFSGFTGDGTYAANTGTVSGVPVPGQFVLFTAPGTAVSAGSTLAGLPFATWSGVDGSLALPGTTLGSGNVSSATSGGVTKQNAIFGHPPNLGRTILSWTLALPSTANLQLGWASAMGDGSLSDTGVQFSVRINGLTYWTMFQQVPAGWTSAAVDLSSWRGQNILVQLVTDSVGSNDYDWAWWADLELAQRDASLPAAPALNAPANGATGVVWSPTLSWSASSGATSYDVYVGRSSNPQFVATTTGTTYAPAGLTASTPYSWRIVAQNSAGSASSATWWFTTQTSGPAAPVLVSPSNGATGVAATPTLSWSASSGATSYSVYFGTSSPPPLVTSTTGTSYAPGALAGGTVYYWQVVAINPGGPTASATWWFTTQVSAPALVSPANGAIGVSLAPTLTWSASTGATSYDVYFGTQGAPPLAINTTGTSYTPGALSSGTLYFWRVVAKDSGSASASATWSFTTPGPTQPVAALRFVPVTPCRIADTRSPEGPFGGPSMGAGELRAFAIPQGGCGIPSSAQAYSLNVTVVPQGPLSYLTLWPTGQDQPVVSTLNSFGGIVVANAAIVPAGFNGAVSVYVTDPTDAILDINGYFDSGGSYAFYPVQPCRVADTRNPAGPFGGPALTGAQSRDFPVPSSPCGLPSTASAYSMNVTVVPGGYLGYLTAWPAGSAQPNVSTLNSWTGNVVANAALVPAGSGGAISVYAEDATQVVLDTNGYFGAPGRTGALNFYPVAPCRVADTRGGAGPFGGPILAAQTARSFAIPASACNIPTTAAAYSLNVTVVPDGPLSYLTIWPVGSAQPNVSTLNSIDGAVAANAAIVPAGTDGAISVYVTNQTHVILDINGYFAP